MKPKLVSAISLILTVFLLCSCGIMNSAKLEETTKITDLTDDLTQKATTPTDSTSTATPPTASPNPTAEPTPAPPERLPDSTFDIYFLDIGQGDAACVICDGHAMLIDGGRSTKSDKIYSFLKAHNLATLDAIVATHPDEDHIGGLAGALNYASTNAAYCTVSENDSKPFADFLKYLSQSGGQITIPSPGDFFFLGCAKVTFIYPSPRETASNNTSIALLIEYGDTSFLFTGDCEGDDESAMVNSDYAFKCDVLKVAHHGSSSSTTDAFLEKANPAYAVIFVDGANTYGHPGQEVLSKLKQRNVSLFRTDIHGDIHCSSDGTTVTFDVEKGSDVDAYIAAGGYLNYLESLATPTPAPTPTPTATPALTAAPVATVTASPTEKSQHTYILNTNTLKFHYPGCSSVEKMKESNKQTFVGTREEVLDMGYSPCGICKP